MRTVMLTLLLPFVLSSVLACAAPKGTAADEHQAPDIEATIAAAVGATIAARFEITFTPEAGGFWKPILDPPPGPDGKYPAGTEVKIRVFLQLSHSSFVGWEGDASGTSQEIKVTVDRDLNLHAVFLHVGTATALPPNQP
jgi:hypothetical protein